MAQHLMLHYRKGTEGPPLGISERTDENKTRQISLEAVAQDRDDDGWWRQWR